MEEPVSDTKLDDLLNSMTAPMPAAAENEARLIGEATTPRRLQHGRAPRHPWVLPGLIAGAVALTAGAGTATVVMMHWGGVSMPLENIRNNEPIPVSWTTDSGHHEDCRVWIELRNPHQNDPATLDAAIAANDWTALGQRLYDATDPVEDDQDGEARVSEALTPVMQSFADDAFPGIQWFGDPEANDTRAVDAWGMTCQPQAD